MEFPQESATLIVDEQPPPGYIAVLRVYLNQPVKRAVIERDTELLTPDEFVTHAKEVAQATYDELGIWIQHECFERRPRRNARNILDVRWVAKWKYIKDPKDASKMIRIIRMRMTQRGFKDAEAEGLLTSAVTSNRVSQRIVVSEAVCRGRILVAIYVRKVFLKGISYEQLAELSSEPKREVNFELDARSVQVLRRLPWYETLNPQTEILHNLRPGAGTKDAPRCFGIKFD